VELIGGLLGPQGQGNATGINESGQIVGRSDISGGVLEAFLWTHGGGMEDLGSLSKGSQALGINSPAGGGAVTIVGISFVSTRTRAVRWVR